MARQFLNYLAYRGGSNSLDTKILIIEDDHKILNFISMALKAKEYQVVLCKNGKEGILSFCTQNPGYYSIRFRTS